MTNSVIHQIDWTLEHRVIRAHPVELAEILGLATEVSLDIVALRATWTAPDGTPLEAVLFNEFVQRTHDATQPTVVFATVVKPAGSDWSGCYTRVALPDGSQYRYPAGMDELECSIQVLNEDCVSWSAPRPPLTPDEREKLYVQPPLI